MAEYLIERKEKESGNLVTGKPNIKYEELDNGGKLINRLRIEEKSYAGGRKLAKNR